jgi:hypothetical protein
MKKEGVPGLPCSGSAMVWKTLVYAVVPAYHVSPENEVIVSGTGLINP